MSLNTSPSSSSPSSSNLWNIIESCDINALKNFPISSSTILFFVERKRKRSGPYPLEGIILYSSRILKRINNNEEEFSNILLKWNEFISYFYNIILNYCKDNNKNNNIDNIISLWNEGEKISWDQSSKFINLSFMPLLNTLINLNILRNNTLDNNNYILEQSIPSFAQSLDYNSLEIIINYFSPISQQVLDDSLYKLFSNPNKSNEDINLSKCFNLLISNGGNINSSCYQGDYCILKAIRQGYENGIDLLLNSNIDLTISHNQTKNTCIHEACAYRKNKILHKLINKIENINTIINQQNTNGDTPLHTLFRENKGAFAYAINEIEESNDILSLLNNNGINYKIQNNNGNIGLHICSSSRAQLEWQINNIKDISLLEITNNNNLNVIQQAAKEGNISRVSLLLPLYINNNISIDFKNLYDINNNTILHHVAKSEEFGDSITNIINNTTCSINHQNNDGNTALHIAVSLDNVDTVEQLLQHNADINITNNNSKIPLDIAYSNVSVASIYQFIKLKPDSIDNNQLFNIKHKNGLSLLHRATEIGHWDLVNELINKGIDTSIVFESNDGFEDDGNALHFAARCDNPYIMDILLSNPQSNINSIQNYNKNTPLHVACMNNSIECVKLLVRQPYIQLNIENKDGKTPIDCAYDNGSDIIISILEIANKELNILKELQENNTNILVIGGGFVGNRLTKKLLNYNYNVYETHRILSKDQLQQSNQIQFDIENKESWNNLPNNIDVLFITMALNTNNLEEFYNIYIKNTCKKILIYGSTSRYIVSELHQEIDETCDIDLSRSRVKNEEFLKSYNAIILALSGIYGEQRQPKNWFIRGRIKNPNKYLNMIHIGDIISCSIWCLYNYDKIQGQIINICDGNSKWMKDLFIFYRYPIPNNNDIIPSKRIKNHKLTELLPSSYNFIDIMK